MSELNKDQVVDFLSNLTVIELSNLVSELEDKWGVSAAAAVAVAGVAGGGGDAAAAEEKTEFDVVLTGFGDKKLNVVKVVKNLTGASLMEAKKMVEGVPATLKEGVAKEEAEKIKAEIEEAGGAVELK